LCVFETCKTNYFNHNNIIKYAYSNTKVNRDELFFSVYYNYIRLDSHVQDSSKRFLPTKKIILKFNVKSN